MNKVNSNFFPVIFSRGYMAPEINKMSCHHINEKVNVYSFGTVVLEIISGREREDFSQRF
jgi:serine/threonine protein kinase